jgi:hypothetical protein
MDPMSEHTKLFARAAARYEPPDLPMNDLLKRRDRERRNQRIAAGVVGIAVFVAAIWIVMSGLSLDRSQTSVVPGGDVTGPAVETGPAVTQPPVAGPATGEPHVVGIGSCSDGASSRLVLTLNQGVRIDVSFEIHRSPTGDAWRISIRRNGTLFFRRTKTANDSGDVESHPPWFMGMDGRFRARAIDRSTSEVCWAHATI